MKDAEFIITAARNLRGLGGPVYIETDYEEVGIETAEGEGEEEGYGDEF